jgi:glycosyltransferase involved in cell wall biosynthesis
LSTRHKICVVLKGYPRLSETFIAQELLGLEKAGFDLELVALRRPTDAKRHPVHDEIEAPVRYLPEYLHEEPGRVWKACLAMLPTDGFWRALARFLRDLFRDPTRNRVRRFGQALVLANEWSFETKWLHSHFIHTPASVTRYASIMLGVPWTCSAHAKDIWTSPDWELVDKLASARWTVTCTQDGFRRLDRLAQGGSPVHLSYHGLDLTRFGHFARGVPTRDGSQAGDPVIILSVGRAVEKKGYDILLRALALLPNDLSWRFDHVGGGNRLAELKALAEELGIAGRVTWRGALAQEEVLGRYREADVFALACRVAADGDRDGLPNVLVEAASQQLCCVSTGIAGVPELLIHDQNGLLAEPERPEVLAMQLERAIRNPRLRQQLGAAAEERVRTAFDHSSSIRQLTKLFEAEWRMTP